MLAQALSFSNNLPGWLQEPIWWRPLTHAVRIFVLQHQAAGLFLVIFFEELGVPLPAPGDVAIAYGGYLTTTGAIPYPLAYLAVVSGAILGSACNLTISRRYGRPFIQRFGKYVGVTEEKMVRAEGIFKRWGPWAIIIGRHIPGMRIVLSALSGILGVPYRVFIPVRICFGDDLGGNLSGNRPSSGASYPGSLPHLPRTPHSMGAAGFGSGRDRVCGI